MQLRSQSVGVGLVRRRTQFAPRHCRFVTAEPTARPGGVWFAVAGAGVRFRNPYVVLRQECARVLQLERPARMAVPRIAAFDILSKLVQASCSLIWKRLYSREVNRCLPALCYARC